MSISALNALTGALENKRQIHESSKQTIQSLNEIIIQIVFIINNNPSAQIRQIQDKYLLPSKVPNSRVRWNDIEISIQFLFKMGIMKLQLPYTSKDRNNIHFTISYL